MRIAFYAPMKPPDHPIASGDRRMARSFFALLQHLGHEVELVCRLSTRDPQGDPRRQQRLEQLGAMAARLLLARWRRRPERRPDLWFTYHLYDKAPDPLGWRIAAALAIPYLVAEASIAPARADGRWALGYASVLRALRRADAVLAMTARDLAGLQEVLGPDPRLVAFPPFLDTTPFAAAELERARHRQELARRHRLDPAIPWLLTVAMMRPDVKLHSYRFLAEALGALMQAPWCLLIAGSGEAEAEVRGAFAALDGRVRFLGRLASDALPPLYAACDLYLWPGFGEAYGMSYLEAQAAGLPVVALAQAGVPEVVCDGEGGVLVHTAKPGHYAAAVATLLHDDQRRAILARTAGERVRRQHGLAVAAQRLGTVLARLAGGGRHSVEPCPWHGC